jgi:hypothetical protein
MPVLAIGGAASYGEHVGDAVKLLADDVPSLVIPDRGHWLAEQAPEEMLAGADHVPDPVPRLRGRGARPRPHAAPTTLEAGDVLFVPAGRIHAVRNAGSGHAAELATCVVEKGKPILTLVE